MDGWKDEWMEIKAGVCYSFAQSKIFLIIFPFFRPHRTGGILGLFTAKKLYKVGCCIVLKLHQFCFSQVNSTVTKWTNSVSTNSTKIIRAKCGKMEKKFWSTSSNVAEERVMLLRGSTSMDLNWNQVFALFVTCFKI